MFTNTGSFKHQVAGDFERQVSEVENAGTQAERRLAEPQITHELKLGESDVGAVDECQEIAQHQERHDAQATFG
ncbi:hypothetical protein [Pseudomonas sp. JAI120]|uniref:hypothetical protein n=1 Tax=Pseudomonas sp. JAI120 TaxID=2723063 RepID=UPI0030DD346A